jgi:hypothetical protein
MKNLHYERGLFKSREEAWSHFEAHWAQDNPAAARKLDFAGMKETYETAVYWNNRWDLIREVTDYTERAPTVPGAREAIAICPICKKSGLVQRGDYIAPDSYVHLMGKKDNGKQAPLQRHFMKKARPGEIFDASY